MASLKLNQAQLEIFSSLELNAGVSVTRIASEIGVGTRTVQRCIDQLAVVGLSAPLPFIDLGLLGLLEYSAYTDMLPSNLEGDAYKVLPVSSVSSFAGQFSGCVSMWGSSPLQVNYTLAALAARGMTARPKALAVGLEHRCFGRRYLVRGNRPSPTLHWDGGASSARQIDDLDFKILTGLCAAGGRRRTVEHALKLSHSTLAFRIKRLEDAGIIAGWYYRVPPSAFGRVGYRLLVRGAGAGIGDRVGYEQLKSIPELTRLTRSIGAWDLELDVELVSALELVGMAEKLQRLFPGCEIQTLMHLSDSHFNACPLVR